MSHERQLSIYRALTGLYPRSFRNEYREDLVLLFSHQIRDESSVAVWARTTRDLAVTVPAHHLEAAMHRPPTPVLVLVCSVMAAGALALALLVGAAGTSGPAVTLVFLIVAVVSGAVGISAWRAQQPISDVDSFDTVWWKLLVGGLGVVAATFAGMSIPWPDAIDLGDNAYWLVVISMMSGIMLGVVGLVLGVATFVRHHRHRPPSPSAT